MSSVSMDIICAPMYKYTYRFSIDFGGFNLRENVFGPIPRCVLSSPVCVYSGVFA